MGGPESTVRRRRYTVLAVIAALLALPVTAAAAEPLPIRSQVRAVGVITPQVQLHGSGWGHGVGMSQYGAYAKALAGRSGPQILEYYYPGTQVTTDQRATDNRIRVGIATEQTSTTVQPLDGTATLRICTPTVAPTVSPRVPASGCLDWFTQAQGEELRIRPLPAAGAPIAEGTETRDAGALITVLPDGDDLRVPAPRGGLLVERRSGDSWAPYRAYATPDDALLLPVLRIAHGDGRIRALNQAGAGWNYGFGWRDVHLTGTVTQPADQRLALVQDVDSVERYLRGLAEVPNSWPDATLQAQAIAGRTYALRGSRAGTCLCDRLATPADQVYIGESKVEQSQGDRWAAAVAASANQVLTFQGVLAETYYSSSHGGRSENVEDSWAYGTNPIPYLRSVDDPWSLDPQVNNSRAQWTASVSNGAMASFLSSGQPTAITRVERIAIRNRTQGGTPRELDVTGVTAGGQRVTFTTGLAARYAKGIAGAAMRRELPVVGGTNDRLNSSQLQRIGFAPFRDDDGSVHEYAITWAHAAGIVQGIGDDRFAPNRSVTRAQMATYLVNTFDIPAAPATGSFSDVAIDNVHLANIEALVAAGIASGFGDGTYGPDRPVTRAQMATFLANALALTGETTGSFSDVAAGDVHAANIEAIAQRGVTTGCDATRYCGGDPVQRGQLASFLQRVVLG